MFLRLSGIAAALAIFSAAAGASAQDNVKVLCVTLETCEALREPFYEKAGVRMDYLSLQTNESLVRIRAETSNPTFDVFYGGVGDPHFVTFREGLTEFYKSPMMAELSPEMLEVTNGAYLPLYSNPIAVIVNPEVLKQAGAPMPKSWRDLTDPRYKGLIGMGDPNSSDTAYVIIATLVQIFGEDEAFDYLAKRIRTFPQIPALVRARYSPPVRGNLALPSSSWQRRCASRLRACLSRSLCRKRVRAMRSSASASSRTGRTRTP